MLERSAALPLCVARNLQTGFFVALNHDVAWDNDSSSSRSQSKRLDLVDKIGGYIQSEQGYINCIVVEYDEKRVKDGV